MGIEIERKYLVKDEGWRLSVSSRIHYIQGYLSDVPERTVRVRKADDKAYLTIKGISQGISRPEFEYEIPVQDAEQLINLCIQPVIEKWRNRVIINNRQWEIDEFLGQNEGLVLAEIELEKETEPVELPSWIDKEVTGDSRYYNSYLSTHPYTRWE